MKYKNQNVGILYFTNPPAEADNLGKVVDGVMRTVARSVPVRKVNTDYEVTIVEKAKPTMTPSLIFTNEAGDLEHIRIEGAKLADISVDGVLGIVQDIIKYNKTQANG
jgi:hypothetical protein